MTPSMIIIFFIAIFLQNVSSFHLNMNDMQSGEQKDARIVRNTDIFEHTADQRNRRTLNNNDEYKTFNVYGKEYRAKFQAREVNTPVLMMNDDGKVKQMLNGEHEVYFDLENNAAFTISSHYGKNGQMEHVLRGNIFADDEEIVLEPHYSPVNEVSDQIQYQQSLDESIPDILDNDEIIDIDPSEIEIDIEKFSDRSSSQSEMKSNGQTKIYRRSYDRLKDYLKFEDDIFEIDPINITVTFDSRSKRAAGAINNYIEMMLVLDYQIYSKASQIINSADDNKIASFLEGYGVQLINMASLCYSRSLQNEPNLKLTIVPKYFVILKSEASQFITNLQVTYNGASTDSMGRYYTDGYAMTNDFRTWVNTQVQASKIPSNFDTAALLTGTNMCSVSSGQYNPSLLGRAPVLGACGSYNKIILEDTLSLDSVTTFAHELGHNLGLSHDNTYNNPSCDDSNAYIMAASVSNNNPYNSLFFSPCSVGTLVQIINTNNQLSCLANTYTPTQDVTNFGSFFPGQLFNLKEQCQLTYGNDYFPVFPSNQPSPMDNICKKIYCSNNGLSYYIGSPALPKTSCGSGKLCDNELNCVSVAGAPTGQCLVEDNAAACSNLVAKYGRNTVCSNWQNSPCCQYCDSSKQVIPRMSGKAITDMLNIAAGSNTFYFGAATSATTAAPGSTTTTARSTTTTARSTTTTTRSTTTTARSTTTASGSCTDVSWCSGIISYCQSVNYSCCTDNYYYNQKLIKSVCQVSCNQCSSQTTASSGCNDAQGYCSSVLNYCSSVGYDCCNGRYTYNSTNILQSCQNSCNAC